MVRGKFRVYLTSAAVSLSQDLEGGGIADRPGDWVDVFHTIFGLAGE